GMGTLELGRDGTTAFGPRLGFEGLRPLRFAGLRWACLPEPGPMRTILQTNEASLQSTKHEHQSRPPPKLFPGPSSRFSRHLIVVLDAWDCLTRQKARGSPGYQFAALSVTCCLGDFMRSGRTARYLSEDAQRDAASPC